MILVTHSPEMLLKHALNINNQNSEKFPNKKNNKTSH